MNKYQKTKQLYKTIKKGLLLSNVEKYYNEIKIYAKTRPTYKRYDNILCIIKGK